MTHDPDSCGIASSTQYEAPKSHSGKNLLFRHLRSRRLGTRCLPSATPTIGRCRRGRRSLTAEDSTSARDRLLTASDTKPRQQLAVHRTFDRCWAHGRASRRALEMGTSARDKVTQVSFRPSLPYPDGLCGACAPRYGRVRSVRRRWPAAPNRARERNPGSVR